MALRILPVVGVILFFGVGLVWRAWYQYRRHGHTGLILFRSGSLGVRSVAEGAVSLLILEMVAQPVAFAISPEVLSWALIVEPAPWLAWTGTAVVVFGVAFMLAAQLNMGASWRVGIEEGATPGLVTSGLHAFCRNPIYLGVFISLAGMALALPTVLSLANVVWIVAGVRYQVSQEEKYLLRTYGQAFRDYASRVGRFVPGLGRMS